jgi:2-oxoglutarate dehydrogenase E2 component (dihydrolipoamide succinyltransferase)
MGWRLSVKPHTFEPSPEKAEASATGPQKICKMALVDIVMPKMGESIMEATILRWHKKPGDPVKQDETLMDIATDKVDSEVPSTAAGTLEEALFSENDVVPVGTVIARIRTSAEEPAEAATAPAPTPAQEATPPESVEMPTPSQNGVSAVTEEAIEIPYQPAHVSVAQANGSRFYSPLVMNIAASEGIGMAELERIPGTGAEGRVTKRDILNYVQAGRTPIPAPSEESPKQMQPSPAPAAAPGRAESAPAVAAQPKAPEPRRETPALQTGANVEVVEMDRMRRLIAEHMVRSKATSAHVTSFAEADVTPIVQWRERVKGEFEKREGERITYTPILIEAMVRCLRKHPMLNASVDGDRILIRRDINIGMATALPSGNLIVPVIRGADQLNIIGLTRQVNRLAREAREGRLKPDDTQGGTFTFTNVGSFGSLMGTPIINQPQVAILAAGAIRKRPVVIETPEGDSIGIRHMMFISMSYDHRIIDGALGATFLSDVVKELEAFDTSRTI